ncbi:MAG: DUF3467 domain-containing protein [Dysgonamonadaceae bacterium]|jgi:hypothetical protein|nr:DUF3467 domain-containing protein [Dysgonamonadaceae bacterium]
MGKDVQSNLKIELHEEVAEGTYANMAIIAHSSSEFILDFIRIMPGVPKSPVQSRVILVPEHAKRLYLALAENIQKYEMQFGEIGLHNRAGYNSRIMGPAGEA